MVPPSLDRYRLTRPVRAACPHWLGPYPCRIAREAMIYESKPAEKSPIDCRRLLMHSPELGRYFEYCTIALHADRSWSRLFDAGRLYAPMEPAARQTERSGRCSRPNRTP
jgi:hypothetical protein